MVSVFCRNTGTAKQFPEGTTLLEIADGFEFEKPYPVLCAKVNNVAQGLKYRVYNNRDVEFLDYTSYTGRSAYCRSLCFLLSKAAHDIFPGCRITMKRPISKGYYCTLDKGDGTAATEDDITNISARMTGLVEEGLPFRRHEARTEEAVELFGRLGYEDKVKLLKTSDELYLTYYSLGDTQDYYYDALVPATSYLKVFSLTPYRGGMLLRVPDRRNPDVLARFVEQPKTFDIFMETIKWHRIMELDNVGDVNCAIAEGKASDLIQISEALQEKKIVKIAEDIDKGFRERGIRLVLITGPTSSGKSSFCQRISVQLKACGLHPVSFSTDDYFVDRVLTPLNPDGSYDFDNFETVDHDALEKDVIRLLAGESVQVPEFNFVTGIREYNGKTLKLGENTVLLIEGIHALNPQLTAHIPDECKYRIFINTIMSLSLDDHNCIPTSDVRLLRRIVRDHNKGAFTAKETISYWPGVRRNEVKWIYPFQENADVMFNSSYLVEFAVMRPHAEQILRTVPKNCPEYSEAHRLLKFLSYFTPVSDREVPPTSMMRGFIGK